MPHLFGVLAAQLDRPVAILASAAPALLAALAVPAHRAVHDPTPTARPAERP